MCVCVCVCVYLFFDGPIRLPPRGLSDACQTRGPAGVCTPAWAHRSMEPTISQVAPCLVQPSLGPGQLGYTQDERAGGVPGSRSSQGERAGQTEEEREEREEEEEDDLRGVSILNNLLMGLPSISNFGCKVVRAVVTHVFSSRAKRDFSRVTATAKN